MGIGWTIDEVSLTTVEWIAGNLSCAPGGYRCLFVTRDGWSTFGYFVLILFYFKLLYSYFYEAF